MRASKKGRKMHIIASGEFGWSGLRDVLYIDVQLTQLHLSVNLCL